jgi:hypothetical protein
MQYQFDERSRARRIGGQVFMTAREENWAAELGKDLQRWEVKAGTLPDANFANWREFE